MISVISYILLKHQLSVAVKRLKSELK